MKILLKEIILLPNLISLFRLLLFIPFQIFFNLMGVDPGYRYYILILILVAFISDLLDGYAARKTNQISEFGKIIDPLADKVLVALIIINLYLMNMIPAYYFWIVILRDILIFLGGIFVSNKLGKVLPSNRLGKITVFSIGIFILMTLIYGNPEGLIHKGIMYAGLILCFASLTGYILRAVEILKWKKNETV
ncbi:MAG: CDP-alcohol phosphatidyltransferase family protein [Melioribacteraceae bacterium]